MIRIDEIYDSVFMPWALKRPLATVHWFDPFGSTDFDDIRSLPARGYNGSQRMLFWDQEPLHKEAVDQTLSQFKSIYNGDLHIITSEYRSDMVDYVKEHYGFQAHYYWFHGWAALDWYRGYDRSGLQSNPSERNITKTFIMPNRIIGGRRQHRLELLYYIFKSNLVNNYISCPSQCPAELQPIEELVKNIAPDAVQVFAAQNLPLNMPNETDHPMHSCWLSLFDESADSLLYLVTETVASGRRLHLTEKTFKPICLQMPFIILGTQGSLEYLRSYGFQTFATVWDESYDLIADDHERIRAIAALLQELDAKTILERQQLFDQARDIVEHNFNHFYSGGFEEILWQELTAMLAEF